MATAGSARESRGSILGERPEEASPSARRILVVDDEAGVTEAVVGLLVSSGYEARSASSAAEALELVAAHAFELTLVDLCLGRDDGFDLLPRLRRLRPEMSVVVITGAATVETAVEAMRLGADDFVVKPVQPSRLKVAIDKGIESCWSRRREQELMRELEEKTRLLERANQELEHLSGLDCLTSLANRRRFEEVLGAEWKRARRDRTPLSLIMADVDFFKAFNDAYGHQRGDHCLRRVGAVIAESLRRPADLGARWGGEEFAVVLPETSVEGAIAVADRVRKAVAALAIPHEGSALARISISLGVARGQPAEGGAPEGLVARADQALYRAKGHGRDRVEVAFGRGLSG